MRVKKATNKMLQQSTKNWQRPSSTELAAEMEQFDADHEDSPLFNLTRGYMAMVMEMMTVI